MITSLNYNLQQNLNTITYKIQQSCLVLNISYIPIEKECKYNRSSRIKEFNLYWTKKSKLDKFSNLRLYLNEVSKIHVISIEEERKISSLAKKWDEKAWKLLILKMQRSVINVAKNFPLWNLWLFDLIQEWNIWLILSKRKKLKMMNMDSISKNRMMTMILKIISLQMPKMMIPI